MKGVHQISRLGGQQAPLFLKPNQITKEHVSLSIDGKMIIFNELQKGDHLLFLYGPRSRIHHVFQLFLDTGLEREDLCLYAFDPRNNRLDVDSSFFKKYVENGILHLFELNVQNTDSIVDSLNDKLTEMYSDIKSGKHNTLRLLIDFGNIPNPRNIDNVIECESGIAEKIKEQFSPWNKRHLTRYRKLPFPLIAVSAFNVASLDCESVKSLIKLHKKVIVSTQNESIAFLTNSTNQHLDNPSIDVIPEEMMAQLVKDNLDAIVLSILQQKPMCGYDIIKIIFKRFHVFISQGTLYPLLYNLEKRGLLTTETQADNRTKLYIPTKEGKKVIVNILNNFIKVHEYLLSSIRQQPEIAV